MTPEEQNLISGLFDRVAQASNQPKDAEADQLIRSKVAEIPSSPYLLVQSALVMQQALSNAQSRIATLEKQVAEAKTGAGAQTGGSFLSGVASLFGGGQSHGQPQHATPPPPPLRLLRLSFNHRNLRLTRIRLRRPAAAAADFCKAL